MTQKLHKQLIYIFLTHNTTLINYNCDYDNVLLFHYAGCVRRYISLLSHFHYYKFYAVKEYLIIESKMHVT